MELEQAAGQREAVTGTGGGLRTSQKRSKAPFRTPSEPSTPLWIRCPALTRVGENSAGGLDPLQRLHRRRQPLVPRVPQLLGGPHAAVGAPGAAGIVPGEGVVQRQAQQQRRVLRRRGRGAGAVSTLGPRRGVMGTKAETSDRVALQSRVRTWGANSATSPFAFSTACRYSGSVTGGIASAAPLR